MAKIEMKGMETYLKQLERVKGRSGEVCKAAVYAGAGVVADEVKKGIRGLKRVTDKDALVAYQKKEACYLSVSQKIGLMESFGITPIREDQGVYEAKLGFDGYNGIKTKRYPKGEPNVMIARTCESGSTHMLKQPFIRNAVTRSRKKALQAMEEAADKKTQEILGG